MKRFEYIAAQGFLVARKSICAMARKSHKHTHASTRDLARVLNAPSTQNPPVLHGEIKYLQADNAHRRWLG